jgi:predicted membrane-bound spermidine synthase
MPRLLLFAIVFIEGFCSLGAEVIALRQIIPHMGSSIVVTAPTIGFFLLALALGYHAGAKDRRGLSRSRREELPARSLADRRRSGGGRRRSDLRFVQRPPEIAYLVLVAGVLCPIAWLLGQTVPILSNLLQHERVGEASGQALYYSTLGSFLGSLSLSLLVMQWLGVSAAVALCALLLVVGYALLRERGWATAAAGLTVVAWRWSPMPGCARKSRLLTPATW